MSEVQLYAQPLLYVNGCQLSWGSNTTLSVAAGQLRDFTNSFDMTIGNFLGQTNPSASANVATTINAAAANGLNALDTGSLAASTRYNVFIVADPTGFKPTGAILSANAVSVGPVMPFGYGLARYVGQVLTDGSAHFLLFFQSGSMNQRTYQYDAPIVVVNALGSTSAVPLSLGNTVPNRAPIPVIFTASFTANTASNAFSLQPTGGTAFPVVVSAEVVAQAKKCAPFEMTALISSGNASIAWKTTSASDSLTLNVMGYKDTI